MKRNEIKVRKLEILSFSSDRKQQKTNANVFINKKEEGDLKKVGNLFPVAFSLGMYSLQLTWYPSSRSG